MILNRLKIILLLISFFFSNNVFANFENSIIVKVDNEIITNFEIKNKILTNLVLTGKEINQKNINDLKERSLEQLIQTKIKTLELSKYNLTVDRFQIDQYLKSLSQNNIQKLKNKFKNLNLDFELFEKYVETELKWQKYIYKIYSEKINIDVNNQTLEIMFDDDSYTLPNTNFEMDFTKTRKIEDYN